MTETQKELERLRTLQETSDFWADVAEKQLPLLSKESTLQEESTAIQTKIDNIKLPEIDTTELAKQGENQEATNSKILAEIGNVATALTAINDTLGTL